MVINKHIDSNFIYLISDIHSNLDLFMKSIKNLDLNKDYLFILGDLIEKGDKNIETLDYIISLENTYKNHVFALLGNCDKVLNDFHSPSDYLLLKKYSLKLGHTILNEFLSGVGFDKYNISSYNEALDLINIKYKKYFDYIKYLPKGYLINDSILLTHAEKNESIKKGLFNELEFPNDFKLNVVGHMPSMMYKELPNLSPLFKDNILFIDGGNNVVRFGGLNLVKLNLEDLSFTYKTNHNYKLIRVKENQKRSGNTYIPQKTKVDFVIDHNSYKEIYINNQKLYVESLNLVDNFAYDAMDIFLELNSGEYIYLVKQCDELSFVIKDNTCGLAYTKNLDI